MGYSTLQPAAVVHIQQVPLAEGYQNSPAASSPLVQGCFPRASWENGFKWLFGIPQTFRVNFHRCEFILHALKKHCH